MCTNVTSGQPLQNQKEKVQREMQHLLKDNAVKRYVKLQKELEEIKHQLRLERTESN